MNLNVDEWKSLTPSKCLQEEAPYIYLKLTVNSGGEENGFLVEDISDTANVV